MLHPRSAIIAPRFTLGSVAWSSRAIAGRWYPRLIAVHLSAHIRTSTWGTMGTLRLRIFLATVMLLLATSMTHGVSKVLVFVHGNDLHAECQRRTEFCVSYVLGAADTLEMVAPHLTGICRPGPGVVTIEQIVDVFASWLEEHPEERHRPAAKLAGMAFADAWPCNK